ncbi:DUF2075 domain-containing protein [bacterium]|nr:DUF2075 domain-containing protein [bacterium]
MSFDSTVAEFLNTNVDQIIGILVQSIEKSGIDTQLSIQFSVWNRQIEILKNALRELTLRNPDAKTYHIILEYRIPRRQKRPDVIILANDRIIVIEFKIGTSTYDASSKWQVIDYVMNLRDFHSESSDRAIFPVLCASEAPASISKEHDSIDRVVAEETLTNATDLGLMIARCISRELPPNALRNRIEPLKWIESPYRPTLTIIEAAERLYGNHSVREISHAYADNLEKTTDMLANVILDAKTNSKRCICFVTGVPGAGKTLTGLNVVHDPKVRAHLGRSGIFLSGNGPLVKIVREALITNQHRAGRKKKEVEHEVSTFIQNVHHFLRHHRENPNEIPHENVVVFDEAQRAWNRDQMFRKQKVDRSEPSELLEVMERTKDWSVIVALVGGGQEIYLGEAGLEEWGNAVLDANQKWAVVASPEVISGGQSVSGHHLFRNGLPDSLELRRENSAHLTVSVRSHRAQEIASWVNSLLDINSETAKKCMPDSKEFPIVMTRNLDSARAWLRARSGGEPDKRCGLVATSEDQRFRAYGLENSTDFRMGYAFEKWFLAPPDDVRSSFMLEVSASEFECQGLELDWVGVCWGGDLTPCENNIGWNYRKFKGSKWQNSHKVIERDYIRNRYRVLLTRARYGMVIWVPPGSDKDPTRDPARFDRLFDYLRNCGVEELTES